ncbi:MAG: hypothetical protein NTX89_02170 [Candidatus Omnitrophica bacterium]|nr:hypothetical protein [Candidatus Omnitrophota bacterium]
MDMYTNVNKLLKIKSINSKVMTLDDDSQWQFFPATKSLSAWRVDDQVVIEMKGGIFSLYRAINKTRKNDETGVALINASSDISKSLGNDGSAEEYTNISMEITIKDVSLDLIWLRDGSKWQMYNPALGVPGFWEVGDPVIVTRRIAIKISKIYEMLNIKTGVTLMAVFLGYEQ